MIARSATAAWVADAAATSPLLKLSMNFWTGAISGASAAVAAPPMAMQTMIPRVRYRILHLLHGPWLDHNRFSGNSALEPASYIRVRGLDQVGHIPFGLRRQGDRLVPHPSRLR